MNALDAYLEGIYYGQFAAHGVHGELTFTYDDAAPAAPISLSLPRQGGGSRQAATNLLNNLLPDRDEARQRMATVYRAAGIDALSLLAAAGGDVAGGLVLVPAGTDISQDQPIIDPALDMDIAERIAAIKRDPDSWAPTDGRARFSLAGSQGKFALARYDGEWYWSNRTMPSTHILKPAARRLPGLEAVEADTLLYAEAVGVPAASASVFSVIDQQTFLVQRFDRVATRGVAARRIHTEDFAQAAGIRTDTKYAMTARQAINMLRSADGAEPDIEYRFVNQLLFNTLIGNSDAHAKNYSILLRPSGISLAPLYDAVPVHLYPEYDQNLAMSVSGARRPRAATINHWRKLARGTGLDVDRVEHGIRTLTEAMRDALDGAWLSVDPPQRSTLMAHVRQNLSAVASG